MMLYGCPERMRVLPHPPMQLRIGEFLVDDLVKLMAVQFIYLELGLLGLILETLAIGAKYPQNTIVGALQPENSLTKKSIS